MRIIILLTLLSVHFSKLTFSQPDSCNLQISLLTCSPGEELYSTFGHSAIRVSDSGSGTDIIYNYGTFDFEDPDFYMKFIRGKLLYFVSIDETPNFIYQYQYEKRGIIEQTFKLSCEEKKKLVAALQENAKEENKYYKYDFVYDNCTTRLRDIVLANCNDSPVTKDIRPYVGVTFRNLIHEYLNKGKQYWSKLGIDLLLGSPLDKEITNSEAMFLPDYLLKAFDSTAVGRKKIVEDKKIILQPAMATNKRSITPMMVFSVLFVIIAVISFNTSNAAKKMLSFFDFLFFLLCGAAGILILFMWFATDHITCRNNYNLLWALPTHMFMAFIAHQKKHGIKSYFRFTFFISMALLLAWFFLPQQMNNAMLPLLGIIIVRSFFLSKKQHNGKAN